VFIAASGGHFKAVKLLMDSISKANRGRMVEEIVSDFASQDNFVPQIGVLERIDVPADAKKSKLNRGQQTILRDLAPFVGEMTDPKCKTLCLFLAIEQGIPELVAELISNGINVNAKNSDRRLPLWWAKVHAPPESKEKIIELLTRAKAKEMTLNDIVDAVVANDLEAVEEFARSDPAQIRNPPKDFPILIHAISKRNDSMVARLLELGADPNECDANRCSALGLAIKQCQDDLVKKLLNRGAAVNKNSYISSNDREPPLCYAVELADEDKALNYTEWLLRKGSNPLAKNYLGDTAVHKAAVLGRIEIIKKFAARGADLNPPGSQGMTPLAKASNRVGPKILSELAALGMHK